VLKYSFGSLAGSGSVPVSGSDKKFRILADLDPQHWVPGMAAMSTALPATLPSLPMTVSKLVSYLAGARYARYEDGSACYFALLHHYD
jgi:hypothetical protein